MWAHVSTSVQTTKLHTLSRRVWKPHKHEDGSQEKKVRSCTCYEFASTSSVRKKCMANANITISARVSMNPYPLRIPYLASSGTGAQSAYAMMAFKQAITTSACCFATSTCCLPASLIAAPKCLSRSCILRYSANYHGSKQLYWEELIGGIRYTIKVKSQAKIEQVPATITYACHLKRCPKQKLERMMELKKWKDL